MKRKSEYLHILLGNVQCMLWYLPVSPFRTGGFLSSFHYLGYCCWQTNFAFQHSLGITLVQGYSLIHSLFSCGSLQPMTGQQGTVTAQTLHINIWQLWMISSAPTWQGFCNSLYWDCISFQRLLLPNPTSFYSLLFHSAPIALSKWLAH